MTTSRNMLAAIDMGSNTFRLTIAEVEDSGQGLLLKPVEDIKESVRLAAGLDSKQRLDRAAQDRALSTLQRFAERLKGFDPDCLRAVGTSTLRVAKNIDDFLPWATRTIGFPIDIISGHEEARLIYVGASHSLPTSDKNRLVIDIGGGSTECILGSGYEPILLDSAHVGCLSATAEYFPDGVISAKAFDKCYIMARSRFAGFSGAYSRTGWVNAYGTSGTARSTLQILNGRNGFDFIRRQDLISLRSELLKLDHVDELSFLGLRDDRQAVFPGGLATLLAAMDEFAIDRMDYCGGALREGILYDILGRQGEADMRNVSIAGLAKRHGADTRQGKRVSQTASALFSTLIANEDSVEAARLTRLIEWAGAIHEIGLGIGHDHYHKHSAYIIEHAEIAGFSQTEQHDLGLLLLSHRGKLGKVVDAMPSNLLWRAILCMRIAVLLHRRRDDRNVPLAIHITGQRVHLRIPKSWLDQHHLTDHLLEIECTDWEKAKVWKEFSLTKT